jgi:SAM-dependent methyltransferase
MFHAGEIKMPTDSDFDDFAAIYNEHNKRSAFNALYERPAALALARTLGDLGVLDAGCGDGAHAAALIAAGAKVTGIDKSRALLATARERLAQPLPLLHRRRIRVQLRQLPLPGLNLKLAKRRRAAERRL